MRYALLVCVDETVESSEADATRRLAEFTVFEEDLRSRGVLLARERLRPTALATTVRTRDGDMVVADGPFAETKEQIAGFYLIECADLDEAIDIASRNPAAAYGAIEVRPVWEI